MIAAASPGAADRIPTRPGGGGMRPGLGCGPRIAVRSACVPVVVALAFGIAPGCGPSTPELPVAPVSGTVLLDGDPAEHAVVMFVPVEGTPGGGAAATTGADGRYVVRMPQRRRGLTGERVTLVEGLPPGRYRVVVSRRLHADGTPMAPDEVPIESPALETIARVFSDEAGSRLTAEVPVEGGTFDWEVKGVSR